MTWLHTSHTNTHTFLSFPIFFFLGGGILIYTQEQEPRRRYPFDFLSLLYTQNGGIVSSFSCVCIKRHSRQTRRRMDGMYHGRSFWIENCEGATIISALILSWERAETIKYVAHYIDGRLNSFYISRGSLNISIRFAIREFCIFLNLPRGTEYWKRMKVDCKLITQCPLPENRVTSVTPKRQRRSPSISFNNF